MGCPSNKQTSTALHESTVGLAELGPLPRFAGPEDGEPDDRQGSGDRSLLASRGRLWLDEGAIQQRAGRRKRRLGHGRAPRSRTACPEFGRGELPPAFTRPAQLTFNELPVRACVPACDGGQARFAALYHICTETGLTPATSTPGLGGGECAGSGTPHSRTLHARLGSMSTESARSPLVRGWRAQTRSAVGSRRWIV